MDKFKVWLISGLVALVVALVVIYFRPSTTQIVRETIKEQLGAVSGPEISFPDWTVNDVKTHYRSVSFNTGTTSLCSIEVPQYNVASTTLISASMKFNAVATTAGNAGIYTGLGLNSTTTRLARQLVGILATGTAVSATTSLDTDDTRMQANDRYLVFDFEGGSSPYLAIGGQTGVCKGVWIEH